MDPRWERLMQDELDGLNTPEQSARLHDLLRENAAARARMGQLQFLFQTLERVGAEEPPADLASAALAALPKRPPLPRAGWMDAWRSLTGRSAVLRVAYPLAAGIALGAFGYAMYTGGFPARAPSTELPISGAMQPLSRAVPGDPVDSAQLTAGGTSVSVAVRRAGNEVWLVAATKGTGAAELRVRFDPARLALVGVERGSHEGPRFDVGSGAITLGLAGSDACHVHWSAAPDADAPLGITIEAGGESREATLRTRTVAGK
jgi:hypothetical protein